jgi:hypothetical protein
MEVCHQLIKTTTYDSKEQSDEGSGVACILACAANVRTGANYNVTAPIITDRESNDACAAPHK